MKLYVLVVGDRHHDPTPFPFTERERALDEARTWLGDNLDAELEDDELGEQPATYPWLFVGTYSHEGDWVGVIERDLDGPVVIP